MCVFSLREYLKNWQETDSPWREIVKWFLRCFYVIHFKRIALNLENIEALQTTQDF